MSESDPGDAAVLVPGGQHLLDVPVVGGAGVDHIGGLADQVRVRAREGHRARVVGTHPGDAVGKPILGRARCHVGSMGQIAGSALVASPP